MRHRVECLAVVYILACFGCVPARSEPPPPSAAPSNDIGPAPSAIASGAAPAKTAVPSATAPASATASVSASVDASIHAVCTKDADCRAFADMCTGCDCRPLPRDAADPKCGGHGVNCFADPCMKKHAACVKGACSIAEGSAGSSM